MSIISMQQMSTKAAKQTTCQVAETDPALTDECRHHSTPENLDSTCLAQARHTGHRQILYTRC